MQVELESRIPAKLNHSLWDHTINLTSLLAATANIRPTMTVQHRAHMPFNHTFNSRDNLEAILVCGTLEKAHRLSELNLEPVQTPASAQTKAINCVQNSNRMF